MNVQGILVDTWAWIEMMSGSTRGDHVRSIVRSNPKIFISALTVYELRYRLEQLGGRQNALSIIQQITDQAGVIAVDSTIAIMAGMIKTEQKREGSGMGAVDCMILATARTHDLKLLTGDRHFAGLDDVMQV
ncbi:MAG: PIN domain-containing protein [Methanoregula sp.]|nr:PIN domain-containing protein [Methanoregula sp.]